MRLLIFGSSGQIARALQKQAELAGHQFVVLGRADVDLRRESDCIDAIDGSHADIVINAAAYTAVDKAEEEPDVAYAINAVAPTAMARAADRKNIPFIHLSTDYVFDGSGDRPWRPLDIVNPINCYGRTKADGERGISSSAGRNLILRTSWVFSEHGSNFLRTMLRIGMKQSTVRVVSDQVGGPTAAVDIAKCILKMAAHEQRAGPSDRRSGTDIFHYSGQPFVSWADFAEAIFAFAQLDVRVERISSENYHTAAKRPGNSMLDPLTTYESYGIQSPDWRKALRTTIENMQYDE